MQINALLLLVCFIIKKLLEDFDKSPYPPFLFYKKIDTDDGIFKGLTDRWIAIAPRIVTAGWVSDFPTSLSGLRAAGRTSKPATATIIMSRGYETGRMETQSYWLSGSSPAGDAAGPLGKPSPCSPWAAFSISYLLDGTPSRSTLAPPRTIIIQRRWRGIASGHHREA